MGTIMYESDYALLTFFKQTKLVLLEWKKTCPPNEYKTVFNKSVIIATENKVLLFVSDMRLEGAVAIENLKWLKKIIIPKAIEIGIQRIALVLNESLYSKIYADAINTSLFKSRIKVNYFFRLDEAIDWVKSEN